MIGQIQARKKLAKMAASAKGRGLPMRHTALLGPGGVGKTKLARMVADLMDAPFIERTASAVRTMPDMIDFLTQSVESGAVVFFDEFHRVAPMTCDQILYPALSDRVVYVKANDDDGSPAKVTLPPFTLIVATTHAKFDPSMARRFKRVVLDYYTPEQLTEIIIHAAKGQSPFPYDIERDAARCLAERSQGVPGVAEQLLADAIDEASGDVITVDNVLDAMDLSEIDALGLGAEERKILEAVAREMGQPIGLDSIKAITGMREVDEQVAFLTRVGLIRLAKGKQGRVATAAAYRHLQKTVPPMVAGAEPRK
jgi:Holliday junction DNA helicase RuvB